MPTPFTRREFLGRTAALSAALLTPGLGAEERPGFRGRIRKAVKYQMVVDERLSVLEKFKLLKELGFEGVEIHTRERLNQTPEEVVRARDESGLVVHGVLNSSNPDLKSAVDLATTYGATSVLVVAGRVNKEVAYDQNYRDWSARIQENAPYAEDQGIKLLVENVWNNFLLSPLEMAQFLDEIDSPAVGAYFDIGNVVRFGYPEQWIRILGRRIGKLDVKDYSRELQLNEGLRKGFNVEIGEGDADYPAVLEALEEIGYSGWATAEVRGGGRDRLAEISRRMDESLRLT